VLAALAITSTLVTSPAAKAIALTAGVAVVGLILFKFSRQRLAAQ
jgi:hypothetical protein